MSPHGIMNTENSYETENTTGVNQGGQFANTPVERLTAASIVGDSVENAQGVKLGTIDNLIINLRTSMVEYAAIEFGAALGIGGKLFAVPFTELKLFPEKKVFVLDCHENFLAQAPAFDKTHWPDAGDPYYDRVNVHWRLTQDSEH